MMMDHQYLLDSRAVSKSSHDRSISHREEDTMKESDSLSTFEKERLERIAQNKRLLAELQINTAVNALEEHCVKKVEAACPPKKTRRAKVSSAKTAGVAKTVRRSRRLEGKTPVYNERILSKEATHSHGKPRQKKSVRVDVTKPEFYSEEHIRVLGSYVKKWELFVNGYDKDGMRIHDPVKGKTCHQCRQKTIGKHTSCSKCQTLKGCFCGDCLFMRYGENIDEVMAKKEWICPTCRDICNCSFCRIAKGWPPTGPMYRKAISEGYKSVAHYLVLKNQQDKENVSPGRRERLYKKSGRVMTRSMGAALNGN